MAAHPSSHIEIGPYDVTSGEIFKLFLTHLIMNKLSLNVLSTWSIVTLAIGATFSLGFALAGGDLLDVEVEMESTEIEFGEDISATLYFTNSSDDEVQVDASADCWFSLTLTENELNHDDEYTVIKEESCVDEDMSFSFVLEADQELYDTQVMSTSDLAIGEYRLLIEPTLITTNLTTEESKLLKSHEVTVVVQGDLEVDVETVDDEYDSDEVITAELTLKNKTVSSYVYDRPCALGPNLELYRGNRLVYEVAHTDEELKDCETTRTIQVASLGQHTTEIEIYDPAVHGELEEGSYTLFVDIGDEDVEMAEAEFEVEDAPGGSSNTTDTDTDTDSDDSTSTDTDTDSDTESGDVDCGSCETPFRDISGHWSEVYITDLYYNAVVNGYFDSDYFQPNQAVTRAEFTKMVLMAFEYDILSNSDVVANTFNDVTRSGWFYTYVETAVGQGLVSGYSGDAFNPNEEISRAEAMTILMRVVDYVSTSASTSVFRDVSESWQVPYVTSGYHLHLIEGYKDSNGYLLGEFGPNNTLTRGEASKIVSLAMDL
jgi:hypothetical protein